MFKLNKHQCGKNQCKTQKKKKQMQQVMEGKKTKQKKQMQQVMEGRKTKHATENTNCN